jgi:hypothetical protein
LHHSMTTHGGHGGINPRILRPGCFNPDNRWIGRPPSCSGCHKKENISARNENRDRPVNMRVFQFLSHLRFMPSAS